MGLTAHGATHPGPRSTNEDAFLIDTAQGAFAVADGMGGHNAGEVAAGLAVDAIRQFARSGDRTQTGLQDAVKAANRSILAAAARRPDYAGMGTTIAVALVTDTAVLLANVGDSRIYRLTGQTLTQLTRDDSWIAKLLADGVPLTPSDIERHPMRHVLTDVVGTRADLAPRVDEHAFAPGDTMLLCSDGLYGALPTEMLAEILSTDADVSHAAEALVSTAIASGATDNVTAVVLRRDP